MLQTLKQHMCCLEALNDSFLVKIREISLTNYERLVNFIQSGRCPEWKLPIATCLFSNAGMGNGYLSWEMRGEVPGERI